MVLTPNSGVDVLFESNIDDGKSYSPHETVQLVAMVMVVIFDYHNA